MGNQQTTKSTEQVGENSEELKLFKQNYIAVASAIDKRQEPLAEMIALKDAMKKAVETNEAEKDPVFAKFLYDDLAPGLSKRLSKEKSNDNNVSLLVGVCCS